MQDVVNNQTESFGYDSLGRLTSIGSRQISYASNGNVTAIGGAGTMAYSNPSKPYQLTSFTPETGIYYENCTITDASYDRPVQMANTNYSTGFTYDAGHDRAKMHVEYDSDFYLDHYYIGGRYEQEITEDEESQWQWLYLGGDAYSAPAVLIHNYADDEWELRFIGRDYLGSITHITDADGELIEEYSYDPWGRLRDPETLAVYNSDQSPDLLLRRGFTGHEHIPWYGLINMNARLYDPLLGRFLAPDPYVQDPESTQNFNRYSYALNNPLKYTDESGEIITWQWSVNGLSIGVNFTPFGVPIGFGLSIGSDGVGLYVEVGYRVACFGAVASCSYSFGTGSLSYSLGVYGSIGCFSANASLSYANGLWGWNFGLGVGSGDPISGIGFCIGYGSNGFNLGIGGYYDNSKAYAFSKGCLDIGINDGLAIEATDEMLKQCQKEWYPDAPMDNIANFTVENVPDKIAQLLDIENANALTRPLYVKGVLSGRSSVYFSERAFSTARQLYTTMGHEFVHVCNYITAANMGFSAVQVKSSAYLEMTEYWAYSYQSEITKSTLNSFNMALIFGSFDAAVFAAFNYKTMSWYKSRVVF